MTATPPDRLSIGIDFGTTNTVVAVAGADGTAAALRFHHDGTAYPVFPSAMCFWQQEAKGVTHTHMEGGPWAIAKYLEASAPHRFIQSFKSFAASAAFTDTRIFRQRFRFEDLLAAFLRNLVRHAGKDFRFDNGPVVIGRPVKFAGTAPDAELAMQRYRAAFSALGLPHAHYVYEPVGAAFFYARRLAADATILVADFGGGTSDFSVMKFERTASGLKTTPLGHAGIGIAGDAFDYRIIDHLVSPRLGKGTDYLSFGKRLTMPNRYYSNFARWSHLPLMKTSGELRELRELLRQAEYPERLGDFITIIDYDLGFELYRAVSAAKLELSSAERTHFSFRTHGIRIDAILTRAEFESWIAPDMAQIGATVDEALAASRIAAGEIDKVFLTGGTSFIPAIRQLFGDRFGEAKLADGDAFESIATGLALIGQLDQPAAWSSPG
jgi:hypothetical chaperone protein